MNEYKLTYTTDSGTQATIEGDGIIDFLFSLEASLRQNDALEEGDSIEILSAEKMKILDWSGE